MEHWIDEQMKPHFGVRVTQGPDDKIETPLLPMTDYAFEQLATRCDIPVRYAKKMRDAGAMPLMVSNFSAWMDDGSSRMVRTYDGRIRAVLSDRYRAVDNYDVALVVADEILKLQRGVQFYGADVSDTLLHLRFIDRGDPLVLDGETFFAGLYVRNSEVGNGALLAQPTIYRQVCMNGMVVPQHFRQVHLGERLGSGIYSPETRRAEAKAVLLKVRDITKDVLNSRKVFQDFIDEIKRTKGVVVEHPAEAIGNLSTEFGLIEAERDAILNRLIADPQIPNDLRNTQFGIVQAITAVANSIENPDRAIELQTIGGTVTAFSYPHLKAFDRKE
jgi:hypothetical protein